MIRRSAWFLLFLGIACTHTSPGHPSGPMANDEVVGRGEEWCRNHGYACRLRDADLGSDGIWRVNFDVEGAQRGRIHQEWDAASRKLLDFREDVRSY